MKVRKLGRYEIIAELGQGAMGVVYRAVDPALNRVVAIKTINMALKQEEMAEYEARFYQEARAAGGLNHPNIVTVYDIGKSGTIAYMAMEFLEGDELTALLRPGVPLPTLQAIDIALQVADGLAYAHEHDVIHRDIKPANIMIARGGLAKITDFGIARMRAAQVVTQTGMVLGSPKYMSPEQVLGKRAEARSDIFSLGAVLYEMLTGRAPFVGADVHAMMFQTLNTVPPPPSTFNPELSSMLDLVVAKMLAKAPDDRYATSSELVADLRECRKLIDTPSIMPAAGAGPAVVQSLDHDLATSIPPIQDAAALSGEPPSEPPPTLGFAKSFDSLSAARRLAEQTGAMHLIDEFAGAKVDSVGASQEAVIQRNATQYGAGRFDVPRPRWTKADKVTFAASVALATAAAAAIVLA